MPLFTTSELRERGASAHRQEQLENDAGLRRVVHGVYATSDEVDGLELRCRALQKVVPRDGVVARRAAAWLHGLDVLPPGRDAGDWPAELLVPAGSTPPRHSGSRAYASALDPDDVTEVHGIRATSTLRTAVDCGRYLPRLDAVAMFDQFLRADLVTRDELVARATELAGQRNVALLRDHIRLADPRAQSPGESWTRVRLIDGGLPTPDLQVPVFVHRSVLLGYLDLGYEKYRVGVEFDGEQFHTADEHVLHDHARRARITEQGWDLVVARKSDVLREPPPVVKATAEALLKAGWQPDDAVVLEKLVGRFAHFRG